MLRPADRPIVAVAGSTGFVGRAAVEELAERGAVVRPITVPRLRWGAVPERVDTGLAHAAEVSLLEPLVAGADVVVNCAGVADPGAAAGPDLYGANSLLPVLLSRACALAGVARLVHISSAAVQGGRVELDESPETAPFSPYSQSKAIGERLLLAEAGVPTVILRPTSVHAAGRPTTAALVRLARSRLSAVAGAGDAPTPQVLLGEVAAAIAHLALTADTPPPIVLQPHNGMTTVLLLRLLGSHEPRHLSAPTAAMLLRCARLLARTGPPAAAVARRLELLLYGQRQQPGWLDGRLTLPPLDLLAWQHLTGPSTVDLVSVAR